MNQETYDWLTFLGYKGSLDDKLRSFFINAGGGVGSLQDVEKHFLLSNVGYSGAIQDMWRSYLATKRAPWEPSLYLDFANRADVLDPRITFSRSSGATRINANGVLESLPINSPRFDYDPVTLAPKGLLIEEQRTNLLLQSEDFSTAWTSSAPYSVSTNVANAPTGQQTADALIVANGQSSFSVNVTKQSIAKATAATTYTHSIFCKSLGATTSVRIVDFGASTSDNASVVVSLVDGSIIGNPIVFGVFSAASVSVTNFGDGWFRISLTFTTDASASLTVRAFPFVGLTALTGDGSSGLLVWGAQLEAGAFATSYIPTTTAAATRAADVAVMTGANFSNWYAQSEGTLYGDVQFNTPSAGANRYFSTLDDGSVSNIISVYCNTADRTAVGFVVGGGVGVYQQGAGIVPTTGIAKLAIAYKPASFCAAANGNLAAETASGGVPILSKLVLGNRTDGLRSINGHIRRISYFPRRLSNSELEGITK